MYLSGATGIVVAGCTFHHNSAGSGGAALIDSLSEVTFSSCTFHDNKASESAGALNINDNSVVDFFNCSLYNHRAIFGGAIVLDYSSDMLFRSSVAHHNSAVYNGNIIACIPVHHPDHSASIGGVFEVEGHSSVTILDSDIYDNWAQGGAVAELAIVSYILVNNSRLFRNFGTASIYVVQNMHLISLLFS